MAYHGARAAASRQVASTRPCRQHSPKVSRGPNADGITPQRWFPFMTAPGVPLALDQGRRRAVRGRLILLGGLGADCRSNSCTLVGKHRHIPVASVAIGPVVRCLEAIWDEKAETASRLLGPSSRRLGNYPRVGDAEAPSRDLQPETRGCAERQDTQPPPMLPSGLPARDRGCCGKQVTSVLAHIVAVELVGHAFVQRRG